MSYEYILTFKSEADLSNFIANVSSSALVKKNGKNIDLHAPDSNSQWSYDVRLVVLDVHKCLVQVATKSEAIFGVFDVELVGKNFFLTEDGDDDRIDLEQALKPSK